MDSGKKVTQRLVLCWSSSQSSHLQWLRQLVQRRFSPGPFLFSPLEPCFLMSTCSWRLCGYKSSFLQISSSFVFCFMCCWFEMSSLVFLISPLEALQFLYLMGTTLAPLVLKWRIEVVLQSFPVPQMCWIKQLCIMTERVFCFFGFLISFAALKQHRGTFSSTGPLQAWRCSCFYNTVQDLLFSVTSSFYLPSLLSFLECLKVGSQHHGILLIRW